MAKSFGNSSTVLSIRDLNVFYGSSHALQGVNIELEPGIFSIVGRNGMGKTTLCKAIMGLVPTKSGTISFESFYIQNDDPSSIARKGIGYVPQGRRLWPSLTVDEHLRMVNSLSKGDWNIGRIYNTFPRLAERKNNGGSQLSGGEQQMLTISRALLLNPKLLIMDEPTEGLAPVIVSQVEDILLRLREESNMSVLLIEQNIRVATAVSKNVAIMVNGRINRILDSLQLSSDKSLQQQLLGVGQGSEENIDDTHDLHNKNLKSPKPNSHKIFISNPVIPSRWSKQTSKLVITRNARTVTTLDTTINNDQEPSLELRPITSIGEKVVLVVGTLDTKGEELRYLRDIIRSNGVPVRLVDISTTKTFSGADVPSNQIAAFHPRGVSGVYRGDRGESVAAMTIAFNHWIKRQKGVAGIITAAGSGGTAMVAPAMRSLPFGIPKVIISTVASGNVSEYVGPSDILMLHSVADIQGLNQITKKVLMNGANAMSGMIQNMEDKTNFLNQKTPQPTVGLTMFGVTTPCIQHITSILEKDFDCIVFHATGVGGQSMEKLIDNGMINSVIDITTTEVCDLLMGGVFAATEDRFGSIIRSKIPYIGSCGALDMVNFGGKNQIPEKYLDRNLYEHNPQVTLMRTTLEENVQVGEWISKKLNQMESAVRFFIPEGGVSLLDKPGKQFFDPEANEALFETIESNVIQNDTKKVIRVPFNINDAEFGNVVLDAFHLLNRTNQSRKILA